MALRWVANMHVWAPQPVWCATCGRNGTGHGATSSSPALAWGHSTLCTKAVHKAMGAMLWHVADQRKALGMAWWCCNKHDRLRRVTKAWHRGTMPYAWELASHGHNAIVCCCTKKGLRYGMMLLQQQRGGLTRINRCLVQGRNAYARGWQAIGTMSWLILQPRRDLGMAQEATIAIRPKQTYWCMVDMGKVRKGLVIRLIHGHG